MRAGLGTRREEENFNKDNIWNQFDSIITLSIYSNYIKIIINLSQEVMTDSLPSVPVVVRGVGAELARGGADLTRLSRWKTEGVVGVSTVTDLDVLHVVLIPAEERQPTGRTPAGGGHLTTSPSGRHSPAEERVAVRHQDLLTALLQ